MEKVIISKENIEKAIQQGAQSISQIYKILGGKGNVSGNTTKKIREIMPDIQDRLNANKNKPTVKAGTPQKPSVPAAPAHDEPAKSVIALVSLGIACAVYGLVKSWIPTVSG